MADALQQPVLYLKGVGPKRALVLSEQCGIVTFEDLLYYFPRRYVDRSQRYTAKEIQFEGQAVTLVGKLGRFDYAPTQKGGRLTTTLDDGTGLVQLVWFARTEWVMTKYKAGDMVVVFGKATFFNGRLQISHPDIEPLAESDDEKAAGLTYRILPFYPSTEGLKRAYIDQTAFRVMIKRVFESVNTPIPDPIPNEIRQENDLLDRATALRYIHFPPDMTGLEAAKYRLKFEELFFFELLLANRKHTAEAQISSPTFSVIGDFFNGFYKNYLPFELTNAQKRVIKHIRSDVGSGKRMNRLIQGDVGSGKTMVAIMAILMALDNGYQAAFMAPTEILATQHFHNCYKYLSPLGIRMDILVGKQATALRKRILHDLQHGTTQLIIGTHALIEEKVAFNRLGLTIIDEQHKFGVLQRAKLWNKCPNWLPHNLAMTATPIPRTLALTVYGDLEVSVIDELPPGRQPVKTRWYTEAKRLEVLGFMKKQLALGRQIYVVYPLVEESQKLDLLAVTDGYEKMKAYFNDYRVGIVHGKMDSDAKGFEMKRFKNGDTHILVSTTVIEVGVDVPNASVMVIENAERFGLSQLHQLRGRVGRGAEQSYCLLMTPRMPSGDSKTRLDAMVNHTDGFKIAEIDLQLRGPGDFLGTRQSGLPEFKLANVSTDAAIITAARTAAFHIAATNPTLDHYPDLKIAYERYVRTHHSEELSA